MKPFGKNVKMFNISLLCPTRNRPAGLERMWESAMQTAKNPQKIELVLYIDNDDQSSILKSKDLVDSFGDQINIIIGKKGEEIYSNLHNVCCSKARSDIFFGSADDLIFRTKEWDSVAIDRFDEIPDKIGYIFPNDGHWGDELGTHGFFHKRWFDALGYLSPPISTVDYSDNYINDVASAINRRFYMDTVLIEHMHWTFGKMKMDQTAIEAHQRRSQTNNASVYQSFKTTQKQREDIEKLRGMMNEYE